MHIFVQLGDYQCKAENDVGEALKTITVAGLYNVDILIFGQTSAKAPENLTRKIELLKLADQPFSEHFMSTLAAKANICILS